jgi:hypothetical protein
MLEEGGKMNMIRRFGIAKGRAALVLVLVGSVAYGIQGAAGATPERKSEPAGAPAAPSSFGVPPTSQGSDPYANYTAPTGPLLTMAELKALALAEAQRDGEPAPTGLTVGSGTLFAAMDVMTPNSAPQTPLAAMSSGDRAALEAPVYVIEMHGEFTLASAHQRHGEGPPQGTVLRLLVDAHTGMLEGRFVGQTAQAPLSSLGSTVALK